MQRALLVIFMAGATLACGQSNRTAKEKELKEALYRFRTTIDEYTFDRHKPPRTLDDLIQARYLREVPVDPMTGSRTTWQIVMESSEIAIDKSAPGIFDVKSGSTAKGLDGMRYSEW
jgi:general secretion pathway protein G